MWTHGLTCLGPLAQGWNHGVAGWANVQLWEGGGEATEPSCGMWPVSTPSPGRSLSEQNIRLDGHSCSALLPPAPCGLCPAVRSNRAAGREWAPSRTRLCPGACDGTRASVAGQQGHYDFHEPLSEFQHLPVAPVKSGGLWGPRSWPFLLVCKSLLSDAWREMGSFGVGKLLPFTSELVSVRDVGRVLTFLSWNKRIWFGDGTSCTGCAALCGSHPCPWSRPCLVTAYDATARCSILVADILSSAFALWCVSFGPGFFSPILNWVLAFKGWLPKRMTWGPSIFF